MTQILSPREIETQPSWKLLSQIIGLSESDNWDLAKTEWVLRDVFRSETPDQCTCGHYPILEICIIQNVMTGYTAKIGNHCIRLFFDFRSDKIFQAISRIEKDNKKSVNAETLEHAHRKAWINNWEKSFYEDTLKKRSMTFRQRAKRMQINDSIVFHFRRKK